MATPEYSTLVHVCEDTTKTYSVLELLLKTGAPMSVVMGNYTIQDIFVLGSNNQPDPTAPAGLVTKAGTTGDSLKIDASVYLLESAAKRMDVALSSAIFSQCLKLRAAR